MAGLYLHIPFCKRRCIYCDFFSTTKAKRKQLMYLLCRELEMRKDYIGGESIETIYFGGGTPSQLSQEDFISIFSHIYKVYNVEPDAEITLEANPERSDSGIYHHAPQPAIQPPEYGNPDF